MKIIQYYRVLQVLVRNSIPVQFQYNFKIEHPRLRAQKQGVKFRIFRPIKQRKSSEFFRIQNFFFTDRMLRGGDKRERSAELLRDAAKAAFGGGKLNKNIQEGQRFGEQNKKRQGYDIRIRTMLHQREQAGHQSSGEGAEARKADRSSASEQSRHSRHLPSALSKL